MKILLKLINCSIIVGLFFILLDMILAIAFFPINSAYMGLPIWKSPPNIVAGIIFDIINGFIIVFVYNLVKESIPYESWKKGTIYGIIMGLFRVVMMAFTTIVIYNVPIFLVVANLIGGFIEIIALGILTAFLYEKLKIAQNK